MGLIRIARSAAQETGEMRSTLLLGSSTVEHSAVNRRVVGSNPTRGANILRGPTAFSEAAPKRASQYLPVLILCKSPAGVHQFQMFIW